MTKDAQLNPDDHLNPLASFHAARADKAEAEVQALRKFAQAVIDGMTVREETALAIELGLLEETTKIWGGYRKTTLLTGEESV